VNVVSITRPVPRFCPTKGADQHSHCAADSICAGVLSVLKAPESHEALKHQVLQELIAYVGEILDTREAFIGVLTSQAQCTRSKQRPTPQLRLIEGGR
jgi:hypothetical protein